jgi:hypothetical protein
MAAIIARKKAGTLGNNEWETKRPEYVSKNIIENIIKKENPLDYKKIKKYIDDYNIPYFIPKDYKGMNIPPRVLKNLYVNLAKEGNTDRGKIKKLVKATLESQMKKNKQSLQLEKPEKEPKKRGRPKEEKTEEVKPEKPDWVKSKQDIENHFRGLDTSESVMGIQLPKNKIKTKKGFLGEQIKYYIDDDGEEGMFDNVRISALGKEEFIKLVQKHYNPEDRKVQNIPIQFNVDVKGILEPKEEKKVEVVIETKKPTENKIEEVNKILENKIEELRTKNAKKKLKKLLDIIKIKLDRAKQKPLIPSDVLEMLEEPEPLKDKQSLEPKKDKQSLAPKPKPKKEIKEEKEEVEEEGQPATKEQQMSVNDLYNVADNEGYIDDKEDIEKIKETFTENKIILNFGKNKDILGQFKDLFSDFTDIDEIFNKYKNIKDYQVKGNKIILNMKKAEDKPEKKQKTVLTKELKQRIIKALTKKAKELKAEKKKQQIPKNLLLSQNQKILTKPEKKKIKDMTPEEKREYNRLAKRKQYEKDKEKKKSGVIDV